jgi:hypothetical protein
MCFTGIYSIFKHTPDPWILAFLRSHFAATNLFSATKILSSTAQLLCSAKKKPAAACELQPGEDEQGLKLTDAAGNHLP